MKMKTGVDYELRSLLKAEQRTLQEYEEMFDDMTAEEEDELREWMAHGKSVNSNPHLLYGENGCPMDFINASRTAEDMAADPGRYHWGNTESGDSASVRDKNKSF